MRWKSCLYTIVLIFGLVCWSAVSAHDSSSLPAYNLDLIIQNVFDELVELGVREETDYEDLQAILYELADNPIDLNHADEKQLARIPFLNENEIDRILLYVYDHPMQSVSELLLVPGLKEYDIMNLLPFVTVRETALEEEPLYARKVFEQAKHEWTTRVDARNLEHFKGDPVYVQTKYKFNYRNRVQFGAALMRPAGGKGKDLQYGAYVQVNRIGILREAVAGRFQAQFGKGLVFSNPFHLGKKNYVLDVGLKQEGLRKYTSTGDDALQGAGATLEFGDSRKALISTSVLYSVNRPNDSLWCHTIGANITLTHKRFRIGVTAAERLYTDSVRYYHNPRYTENFFHGSNQAIVGLNARYYWRWLEVFGEVAAAQNEQWGIGLQVGTRLNPIPDIGLVLLYRYYSPTFDNTLGYGFSETNRINDENGGYIGIEVKSLRHWLFSAYGDVFYFSGIKYGIPNPHSWGYDAYAEAKFMPKSEYTFLWQVRAREKAKKSTYSLRFQFNYDSGGWHLRTEADGNIYSEPNSRLSYGGSIFQDIQYSFRVPVSLNYRLQYYYTQGWNNRIYTMEKDVLYGFSIPAFYGQGIRTYLNVQYRPIDMLRIYLRVSESIFLSRKSNQTDIHLMLRLYL